MSALLLALLHDSLLAPAGGQPLLGEGSSGNVLLDGLNAVQGPALATERSPHHADFNFIAEQASRLAIASEDTGAVANILGLIIGGALLVADYTW